MRTESAAAAKGRKTGPQQKIPREGTTLRELWDLLHIYRGVLLVDSLTVRFQSSRIEQLRNFYGLDVRLLSHGSGSPGRWVLAGEWKGSRYVDYIAERLGDDSSA